MWWIQILSILTWKNTLTKLKRLLEGQQARKLQAIDSIAVSVFAVILVEFDKYCSCTKPTGGTSGNIWIRFIVGVVFMCISNLYLCLSFVFLFASYSFPPTRVSQVQLKHLACNLISDLLVTHTYTNLCSIARLFQSHQLVLKAC